MIELWNSLPEVIRILVKIVVILAPLMGLVAYYTLAERKIIGYMQIRIGPNRVGPRGLLQPIADAVKLMFKEIILPTRADKTLFIIAPLLNPGPGPGGLGGLPLRRKPGPGGHRRRPALHPGPDLPGRLRRHHRRLGLQFQVCPAWRHALRGPDRRL